MKGILCVKFHSQVWSLNTGNSNIGCGGEAASRLIYCCLPQCHKIERWTNNWHSNTQFLMFSSCLFNDHFCDRLHKHMANRTRSKQLSSKSKLMFVILQHILNVLKTYLRPSFLRNPMNFTPKTLWEFSSYRYIQKVISLPVITKWLSQSGWMRHGRADPKHIKTSVIKSSPRLADFTISVFVYYTCVTIFLPPASLLAVKANRYVDV